MEGKSTTSVGRTGSSKGKVSLARQTPRFIRPPGCRAQPWIATRPRPPVKILLSRSFPPPNSPIEPLPSANYVRKSPAHLSSGQAPPQSPPSSSRLTHSEPPPSVCDVSASGGRLAYVSLPVHAPPSREARTRSLSGTVKASCRSPGRRSPKSLLATHPRSLDRLASN